MLLTVLIISQSVEKLTFGSHITQEHKFLVTSGYQTTKKMHFLKKFPRGASRSAVVNCSGVYNYERKNILHIMEKIIEYYGEIVRVNLDTLEIHVENA